MPNYRWNEKEQKYTYGVRVTLRFWGDTSDEIGKQLEELKDLFPIAEKRGLSAALEWLYNHETQGLPRERGQHLLTEAFHAQTRGAHTGNPDKWAEVRRRAMTKESVVATGTKRLRDDILQGNIEAMRELAEEIRRRLDDLGPQ